MLGYQYIVRGRELEWVNTLLTFGETLFAWNIVDVFIMNWILNRTTIINLIVATVKTVEVYINCLDTRIAGTGYAVGIGWCCGVQLLLCVCLCDCAIRVFSSLDRFNSVLLIY